MNRLIILLIASLLFVSASEAKKIKQPDTYAYTRGVEVYSEGKYDEALEWFNKELSENPDNGYAYFYISCICYINSEYGKSLSALDNAMKLLPKKDKEWRAATFASRAEVFKSMGDTVKALDDLSHAIKTDPSDSEYYESRAQIYFEQNNYALADADYMKMKSLNQGDVKGYMGMGRNATAQKRWDDAINEFSRVVKLAPEYPSGYSYRAQAYMGKKMWNEATDDIIKALDIDGDRMAFELLQELPDEASALLKTKLKIQMAKNPTNVFWPLSLSALAFSIKDYDESILYSEKANTIDANSVFMENIARCYVYKEDLVRALDYVERAIAMNPEDYDLVHLKADILSRLGKYDECLVERDRYVEKYPEDPEAYFLRAEDLLNARRINDAIENYNTAVILAPRLSEFPYLLMRRGDAYRFVGKKEEANKDYESLLKVEKDSVLSADSRTPFAYSGLGNAEKAIETMQYILKNDTTDIIGTLYETACVYARLGQKTEAIRYLKDAIEKGFSKFIHIETDYDLDCLRDMPEYKELLASHHSKVVNDDTKSQNELTYSKTEIVEVPFTKEGGVTKVKCSINGLPLHFVFDTGAADVTMSMVEANFMLKNDYIKPDDVIGSARYIDANGDISEGTIVNLRTVNFGGLELKNVRATVVRNQMAPLLLGQSVLGRLGKIEIDNNNNQLKITQIIYK